ncbi:anhydro-N-acetylmuramic acid kinase AnmK [Carnobacterium pleistocenium]|uniref:anhydro-N-acetylmuramic acid kinase AnmK n=1 Tax=Carnobacterium pleistocenium TaxID=181073 RepID=UPI000551998A|nr:anhydro-N-acetylmuramic acid kinase AnmK [Carnobacterium pleistocenium]
MAFAVGIMSGTSLDGVDAALVEIHGTNTDTTVQLMEFTTYPLSTEIVKKIKDVLSVETSSVDKICSLNVELGYVFSEAAKAVCEKADFALDQVDFVASHGQTIYHLPVPGSHQSASTFQIGESAIIAEETKTMVVSDFRTRDMAVNGQGAPIVPYSEFVLYRDAERTRLLQNIGGIGNVTIIPSGAQIEEIIAFDTGPGNMIIDELCQFFYQEAYDKNGEHASQGIVDQEMLSEMMAHPYIERKYPKTTGREDFGAEYTANLIGQWQNKVAPDDFIATATRFTAQSIAVNISPFIDQQTELIIGGGGSYNPTLVQMIKEQLPEISVLIQEEVGFSSEAKEAIAMTILANQTIHHLPSNVPSATGAMKPVILGKITYYH